ncbi:PREDICTED: 2-oxoglutarate and iron-dependent oxygenase domain-containing protein 3-like [Cyphomyrmex costatus]|uniref:2-oxoglutarate and iron-dependent oxygenase domain-containing protein 3-like n=1 Tax=Cyphomyrmex costatus TaxID=456900 RepID=UPI0008523C57|nr:PREDICTED: 2-oxoglutarate and iron-dependent oxygenase domain-containing protein 3-like [Cyphomyrmex costatus]
MTTQELKRSKRKSAQKESVTQEENKAEKPSKPVELKYGPIVSFPHQRVWSRCVLILGVLLIVWCTNRQDKEVYLAKQKDVLVSRTQNVDCSMDYNNELEKYCGCVPEKCGRVVTDKLVSTTEADILLKVAKSGLYWSESDGGANIVLLYSGAFSKDQGFVNIYASEVKKIFNSLDTAIYKVVETKIQHAVARNFGRDINKVYLNKLLFFSRMTNKSAKTIDDEYWHPHVDKELYESLHYTVLLYLSDFNKDFEGGRFIFMDKNGVNTTVEPRKANTDDASTGCGC